jgi:hypothetical protein
MARKKKPTTDEVAEESGEIALRHLSSGSEEEQERSR